MLCSECFCNWTVYCMRTFDLEKYFGTAKSFTWTKSYMLLSYFEKVNFRFSRRETGIRTWRSWHKSHFLKKKMTYLEHFWFKTSFHAWFLKQLFGQVGLATQMVTALNSLNILMLQSAAFFEFVVWPQMRLLIDSVVDCSLQCHA